MDFTTIIGFIGTLATFEEADLPTRMINMHGKAMILIS